MIMMGGKTALLLKRSVVPCFSSPLNTITTCSSETHGRKRTLLSVLSTQQEQRASSSCLGGEVAGETKPNLSVQPHHLKGGLGSATCCCCCCSACSLMSQGKSLSQHRANRRNAGLYDDIFQMTQLRAEANSAATQGRRGAR